MTALYKFQQRNTKLLINFRIYLLENHANKIITTCNLVYFFLQKIKIKTFCKPW